MKKIMFNDAYGLTQATIAGRKTMTRRLEFNDVQELCLNDAVRLWFPITVEDNHVVFYDEEGELLFAKPTRYKLGDVVAVAQSYKDAHYGALISLEGEDGLHTGDRRPISELPGWTNKMFVRASLMHYYIRITGIKVERLQDISDEDCIKEGIFHDLNSAFDEYGVQCGTGMICLGESPREAFASLIDKVSGRGTWASNPWVVAYEYELVSR